MKKIVALLAVVLLPLLASAYQLEPKYADMAKEFDEAIQLNVAKSNKTKEEASRTENIEKVKSILSNAKYTFESSTWGASGGTGGAAATMSIGRHKYYKTEEIKSNLAKEHLDTFLQNDKAALSEVADYITDHRYYIFHNDFETLLAVGVSPIEAAIRTKNEEYIKTALEDGEITYQHCYMEAFQGNMHGGTIARSEYITIQVQTTQEEVNAIKEKLNKKKSSAYSDSYGYMEEVGRGMESFVSNK